MFAFFIYNKSFPAHQNCKWLIKPCSLLTTGLRRIPMLYHSGLFCPFKYSKYKA